MITQQELQEEEILHVVKSMEKRGRITVFQRLNFQFCDNCGEFVDGKTCNCWDSETGTRYDYEADDRNFDAQRKRDLR